jgi:hypothetical protein
VSFTRPDPILTGSRPPALTEIKTCLECGDTLVGRTDKKFCSDQCRASFHNRQNGAETGYARHVNLVLRKNRRILSRLNTRGRTRVSANRLREQGFDFRFFTNIAERKDGGIYYYCYEQGYRPIEKEYYLLVVKPDIHP